MRTASLTLGLFLMVAAVWGGFVGNWEVFGDADNAFCIVYDGRAVWLGTGGGVVEYFLDGNYKIFTTIDGLGGLEIPSLAVDGSGAIWYISRDGYVGVFEKGEWKTADDLARSFYELNKIKYYGGYLWIATNRGIVKARPVPESFAVVQFEEYMEHFGNFPAQVGVNDIEFLHDTLFVATEYGVAYAPLSANLVNPAVWETTAVYDTVEGGIDSRGVWALGIHHDTLWVLAANPDGTRENLYYFHEGRLLKKRLAEPFSRTSCVEIVSISDTLWVMDKNRVFYYSPESNSMVTVLLDAPVGGATDAVKVGNVLFFATRYGIGELVGDNSQVRHFNSIFGSTVADMTFVEDYVIVATAGGGINLFYGGKWEFIDYYTIRPYFLDEPSEVRRRFGKIFDNLRTAVRTPDGVLWLGSYGGGILKIYPDSTLERWDDTSSSLASSGVSEHYPIANRFRLDPMGNLWVVSYQSNDNMPLKVWPADRLDDPYGAVGFEVGEGIPHKEVRAIACDWDKVAVATAYGAGIIYHKGTVADKSDDEYELLTGLLPSDECNATAITPDGRVWFGTGDGLAYWDPAGYVAELPLPEELSATITSLAADSLGNLWIATLDGAALYMADGYFATFKSFHSDDASPEDRTPLLNDAIGTIGGSIIGGVYTDGKSGNIWFGFNEGLVLLHSPYGSEFSPESLIIYPNPVVAERGILPPIYIGNLPADAPVLIYDAAGNLVREIAHYWKGQDGFIMWDALNSDNEFVAPGVYSVVAPSKSGVLKGRLLIVR